MLTRGHVSRTARKPQAEASHAENRSSFIFAPGENHRYALPPLATTCSIDHCASPFGRQGHQLLYMLLPQYNKVLTITLALELDLQLVVTEAIDIAHSVAT